MELVCLPKNKEQSKTQIEMKIDKLKKSDKNKTVIYATTGSVA